MGNNLKNLFESVRDIPYRVALTLEEEDCSCIGKHQKLLSLLKDGGHDLRWRAGLYSWSKLPLPTEVLDQLVKKDNWVHSFLEIKLGEEWITLDVTWDKKLAAVLPVNFWDGKSNTQIAVPIEHTFSPEESSGFIERNVPDIIRPGLEKYQLFFVALNHWLESVRSEK